MNSKHWVDPMTKARVVVDVEWETIRGRAEPVVVTVRSQENNETPITAALVRRIPIGNLMAEMRRGRVASHLEASRNQRFRAADRRKLAKQAEGFGASRGVALPPDAHANVAAVYAQAWAEGRPRTRAVADAFHIAPSTAAKRIMKARAAGYLKEVDGK